MKAAPWDDINFRFYFFAHLKLCLAAATHNFKWVKNGDIWLIWDQILGNIVF